MKFSLKEEEIVDVMEEVIDTDLHDLVVYNDDYNTFDHVINTLKSVCKHSAQQAEQCTYIIHYKGKCTVKKDTIEKLRPMKDAICDAGIDARIH
ncbi:MAG: ATP-dependent Clp protease adaptor ClpS [Cyclobacteriaceae bacterium]|nr:ATP-dependent Clp protease adaptor ClpS [Cyclobacteriaceae bacterium]